MVNKMKTEDCRLQNRLTYNPYSAENIVDACIQRDVAGSLQRAIQNSQTTLEYIKEHMPLCLAKIMKHNACNALQLLIDYWDKDQLLDNLSEYHQYSTYSEEIKTILHDHCQGAFMSWADQFYCI